MKKVLWTIVVIVLIIVGFGVFDFFFNGKWATQNLCDVVIDIRETVTAEVDNRIGDSSKISEAQLIINDVGRKNYLNRWQGVMESYKFEKGYYPDYCGVVGSELESELVVEGILSNFKNLGLGDDIQEGKVGYCVTKNKEGKSAYILTVKISSESVANMAIQSGKVFDSGWTVDMFNDNQCDVFKKDEGYIYPQNGISKPMVDGACSYREGDLYYVLFSGL